MGRLHSRWAGIWLGGLVLAGLAGCQVAPKGGELVEDVRPMHEVIARVNANSQQMDFLFRAGGVSASGEYIDDNGRTRSFDMTGTLLYRKPRDLYLSLKPIAGSLEAGSNDEEFWIWQRIDGEEYWWGRHTEIVDVADVEVPIRPDLLVEVLGLGELPTETQGPEGPVFWVGSDCYELVFLDRDETGQLHLDRTITIGRQAPFLVRSIVHFRRGGIPVTVARLSRYAQIAGSDVLAPRMIRIEWLDRGGWIQFEFMTMKRFEQTPKVMERFMSPRQRGIEDLGRVIRVTEPIPKTGPADIRPATRPAMTLR